jgi:putative ABC transport system permease protein
VLNISRLALRQLIRDVRSGQWLLIIAALILATTAITSIQFIANRLQQGLNQQSSQLLGGDLVVESTESISDAWKSTAKKFELQTAEVVLLQTITTYGDAIKLINLQAVSDNYPLFGERLQLQTGEARIDTRMQTELSMPLPATLKIGNAIFKVRLMSPASLELNSSGWMISPRVIIRMADLDATKTLIPGSRANYRLLLRGSKENLQAYQAYLLPKISAQQKLLDPDNQRYELLNNFNNIVNYIQLTILLCILMCGVAISISVRQYIHQHYQQIALWRCLGANSRQIITLFIIDFLFIATCAGLAGIALGSLIHHFATAWVQSYFPFALPDADWRPYLTGFLTSLMLLFCYAYPIIQVLPNVKPLELWREESSVTVNNQLYPIAAFILFFVFVMWLLNFSLFALLVINAILLSVGFFYLLNIMLFAAIKRVSAHCSGVVRRGLSQITQFSDSSAAQINAFALVLMSIFLLSLVKNNLLDQWRGAANENAPNYFAFNIAPNEIQSIVTFFKEKQLPDLIYYPMIRGRLTTLNQRPIQDAVPSGQRAHNALRRELNLSATLNYPADNIITEGSAWSVNNKQKALVSVESSLASALHLNIGDTLGFLIDGQTVEAKVSNIRTVSWGAMHPNFYIIFTPDFLRNFTTTYITSFRLNAEQTSLLKELVNRFPNLTVLDIADTLNKIQSWISNATTILQALFLFSLCSAILIFIATLLSTMDERRHTYRLVRILGASRRYISLSITIEISVLLGVTLLFSYLFAQLVFYILMKSIF